MKKRFIILLSVTMFFCQIISLEAKEKPKAEEVNNNYHTINYEVSESRSKKAQFRSRNTLPESYDSRQSNNVTSVKNQNPFGCCWAFSAVSTAETSALKNQFVLDKNALDLSELQLAYFFYHRENDPLGNTAGDRNTALTEAGKPDDYLQNGGNNWLTAVSLSQWPGPVAENKAPFVNDLNNYPRSLDGSLNYLNTEYAMKDAVFIPDDKTEEIKQAVIQYGSVSASYCADGMSFYDKYFFNGSDQINHSITIVGYDDSIQKESFGETQPQSNGAWIVKNSWSSAAGDNGYFYLSYEQPLNAVVAYDYMKSDQYDHNYFYDGSSGMDARGTNSSPLTAANVFKASGGNKNSPEHLKAVSIGISDSDTDYSIQVYTDLKDRSNPNSGTKAFAQPVTGSKDYEGFYTIQLPNEIKLNQGSYFSVVVTLKNRNNNSGQIFVSSDINYGWISTKEETEIRQSFWFDGNGWYDTKNIDVCNRIKAFTVSDASPINSAKAEINDASCIYNKAEQIPDVKIILNGTELQKDIDYSMKCSNNVKAGRADITITGQNKYCGTINRTFTVHPQNIAKTNISDITAVRYNGKLQYPVVTVKENGSVLQNGVDYTLSYGSNIKAGSAEVSVKGQGNYTGEITKHFTILPCEINSLSFGNISTKPYTGKPQSPGITVQHGNIILKNGTDYTVSYSNNINPGTATVTVTGKGNYTGRAVRKFQISKYSIDKLEYSKISDQTYSGRSIKPQVTIKNGAIQLKRNTDYTLSYGKNKNTGKGTVKINGRGKYTGSVVRAFYIVPKKTSITSVRQKKKGKLSIKYKKSTGASGYQIAYRKKGARSYKYVRTSKKSYTLSKCTRRKYYQIKVRAYKTVGKTRHYGSYSKQKTVRVR